MTQHTRFDLFQKLLSLIESPCPALDQECVGKAIHIAFLVLDRCAQKRHVLMQVSCVGDAAPSFLQLLLKCAVGDASILHRLPASDAPGIQTKALQHVKNIVRKSIPYPSLDDWAQCSGCYSDQKMHSMLTHNITSSILRALLPHQALMRCPRLSMRPTGGELRALFEALQAASADAAAAPADAAEASKYGLCRDVCCDATVQELLRNLHE